MKEQRFDVVVIGGGPSGSTIALRMAKAGWKTAIVEKESFPRRKVCGEFISATNAAILNRLGIAERTRQVAGAPISSVALYTGERILSSAMPRISDTPASCGFAVGRDKLDTYMIDEVRVAGGVVFQPAKVTAIEPAKRIVKVEDAEGIHAVLKAPVLVAAHGSWGVLKLPSFPAAKKPHQSDMFGFKAHFTAANLKQGLMPMFVFPGGYGGLVETDGGRVSFSACIRRDRLAAIRNSYGDGKASAGEIFIAYLIHNLRGIREVLGNATVDCKILTVGPIRPGIRQTFADGIFRVGNAAGEAHPIIAEGISLAIQSSWLLSDALLSVGQNGDVDTVAKCYRRQWLKSFEKRIRFSFLLARLAMSRRAALLLSPVIQAFPQLISYGASLSGKARVVVR